MSATQLARDPDVMAEPQLGVDAPGAVDATGAAVDLADALGQEGFLERALGGRATLPGVEGWRLTPSTLLISEIG